MTIILCLTVGLSNAQNLITQAHPVTTGHTRLGFVTPASLESTSVLDEYESADSCSYCGNSSVGCCCGGPLHHGECCWDGNLSVGLNAAAGNSENVNFILGFDAKRVSGLNTVTTDLDYFYNSEDTLVSDNRLYWLTRYERDIPNTAWSWFGDSWVEYDEFEDFDLRIGLHVGGIVTLFDTGRSKLRGLVGLGTSKKCGSPDDQWKPEALLGAEYACQLNDRQKITLSSMYYSDIGDPGSFRLNTKASWQCVVDEKHNLSVKISAFDRWDSTPSTSEQPNDINYWCSLALGF